jgi:putative metallohydrolase (TIGR04338 family)
VASSSIRDSQRQRVYDSERLAFEGLQNRAEPYKTRPEYKTVAECQGFVDEVTLSPTWKYLCPPELSPRYVTVTDGRGRRRGGATARDTIAMPKFARRQWYLLHELAHVALWDGTQAGEWPAHGPEYVCAYLHLLREVLGPEPHAALTEAMAAHRIKVCSYMGGGVYDSTTVEYVTAIDTPPFPHTPSESQRESEARRCSECAVGLSRLHRGRFCSDECRWTHHNKRRHLRSVDTREKACEVCGREFVAKRADTKTCSPACRQKSYRQRLQLPT